MIEHPNNNIHIFLEKLRKGDTVYIHPEAEYHPSTMLQKIINAGMVPGTTLFFGKDAPYGETLKNIRELRF